MLRSICIVVACAICVGCGARQSTPNAVGPNGVFKNAGLHEVTQREYYVDPPDELIFHCPDIRELDNVHVIVRPDGKVSLELIGEVKVSGKTPQEIAELTKKLLAPFYIKPEIRMDVISNSKFFYTFGWGTTQGRHQYVGQPTVINALSMVGFNQDGWPQQIRLSRPGRNGEPNATVVIDFTKIEEYGDMTQNYLIEEGDIIDIPYAPLSAWNFTLQRLLGPLTGTMQLVSTPVGVVSTARGAGL